MKLSVQILLAFSTVIILSIADSYTNYLLSLKVERNIKFLSHSGTVIRNSNNIHKSIIEMQSAFRGYLLTDDLAFLENYDLGLTEIPKLFNEQQEIVSDNNYQLALLDTIRAMHKDWIIYSSLLIELKQKGSQSPESSAQYNSLFRSKLRKQVGKKLNDSIAEKFRLFDKNEYQTRAQRSALLIDSIERTRAFSNLFLALTIIIGTCSTIYIMWLISRRIYSMVQMAENISEGRFEKVDDGGGDELTALARSLNLMSDKLSKTIRELEARNVELDKFAYAVSHDLKAPIRGIHNVINWIREDLGHEISDEMEKYLRIIPQRTKRMENLINGLLDYACTSHRTRIELTDTEQMVRDIVESIVPRTFVVELDDLPVFSTEKLKLEQVFSNLISNAVKYTPQADGYLHISCRSFPDHYLFSVKDNGIGIDAEYHDKIFEIFQTLREKDEKESTGVGLAIVKKIIDDQHGTITLYSEPGEGTEFIFTWKKNLS
jgi:signal transduction histidine kinase